MDKNKKKWKIILLIVLLVIALASVVVYFSSQESFVSTDIDFQSKSVVRDKITDSLTKEPLPDELNPFGEEK